MVRGCLASMMLFLALALLVGAPGWAWAAEDAEHAATENPILSWRGDLAVWTIVVFGLLFLVLRKYAWGPMLEGLKSREQAIRGALEEARLAREDAQRLRDQLQQEMDRAQEKVRDILDQGRRDAQRMTEEMLAKARADIQTERERLHREVAMARDQALQELWNQTARLATLISAKAIRRELNSDDHRRLLEEAIADLRHAGKERQRQMASVQA